MNKNQFKLPVLSLLGGALYYLIIFLINLLGYGDSWSPRVGILLSYIPLALNIIILVIIGLILRKTYDRNAFFKAATILVVYSIVLLAFRRLAEHFGFSNDILEFILNLPISLFGIFSNISVRYNLSGILGGVLVILSLLEPYILAFFGKEDKPHVGGKPDAV